MSAQRDAVIIYGTCQAQVLALLASRVHSLSERFTFHVVTDTAEPGQALQAPPPEAKHCIVLWEQHDQRPSLVVRDELRRRVPRGVPVVRFPGVSMNALWPFRTRDKRNKPEPGFPWGRFPIGDRVALTVATLGLTGRRAFDRYVELTALRMPDVAHLLDLERAVYRHRDALCDVRMGDFVFANLRDLYQFWTFGHLSAAVYRELLLRLLERSGGVIGGLDPRTRSEIDAVIETFPGQGDLQLPLHPQIIEQLGLQFVNASTTYKWYSQTWTFEEYMTRYISFDRSW